MFYEEPLKTTPYQIDLHSYTSFAMDTYITSVSLSSKMSHGITGRKRLYT